MSRVGLTSEQNERLREYIRGMLRQPGETQASVAGKVGMTQPGLSSFLSGRAGTTYPTVELVANELRIPEWEVLGKPPPSIASLPPRLLAAELARQIGVSAEVIAAVLAEPETPQTKDWPALLWTDRMRLRHLDLVTRATAGAPAAPQKNRR